MDDLGLLKPICLLEKLFNHKLRLNESLANQFAGFSVIKDVISTAAGSAMVTVGATRVLCGIKVKVIPTLELESPFVCSVERTNLSQRILRATNPVSREIQTLSVQLDWILRTCAIPDAKEQLQIYFAATDANPDIKKMVCGMYILHVDLLILHDDGCLLDACLAAALAALSCAEWPKLEGKAGVSVGLASQTITSKMNFEEVATPQSLVRLRISDWPVALTFALVPRPPFSDEAEVNGKRELPLISQPSRRELLLWDTDATIFHIVLDSEGAVVDFGMVGGLSSCLWAHLEEAGICHNRAVLPELLSRATKECDAIRKQLM
ncbi:unnamed protein product [Schistocephalus solidus]|uniref:Ribosomal RNA-processing protein 43 n=1 Tax=Schistocephalus solidus TaxID=70667 RepID=A0A183SLZ7_SCHSO|nr:unnamed protein product [Schistocephalus solidus]